MQVARTLAARRQVFSVHVTTGTFELYALVCAPDRGTLPRLLLDDLSDVDGLLRTRVTDAPDLFTGGRLLDDEGRAVDAVPVDPWALPRSA